MARLDRLKQKKGGQNRLFSAALVSIYTASTSLCISRRSLPLFPLLTGDGGEGRGRGEGRDGDKG